MLTSYPMPRNGSGRLAAENRIREFMMRWKTWEKPSLGY